MRTGLELARVADDSLLRGKRAAIGAGIALAVTLPVMIAMVPFTSLLYVSGFVATCAALAAAPWPRRDPDVYPEDICDLQLRQTYCAILGAREELEIALANAPAYAATSASLQQRCQEAVRLCARVAPVANRLHAYLSQQEMWMLARQASDLRARSQATTDATAARTLAQAAAAYERQIASCEELTRTRDRIQARLELVLASLRGFAATVIKQQTLEDEQLALAGETVTEHVDGVREELSVLESALSDQPA